MTIPSWAQAAPDPKAHRFYGVDVRAGNSPRRSPNARYADPSTWNGLGDGNPGAPLGIPAAAKVVSTAMLRWAVSRRDRSLFFDQRLTAIASGDAPHFITAMAYVPSNDDRFSRINEMRGRLEQRLSQAGAVVGLLYITPARTNNLQGIVQAIKLPDIVWNTLEGDAKDVDEIAMDMGVTMVGAQLVPQISSVTHHDGSEFPAERMAQLHRIYTWDTGRPNKRYYSDEDEFRAALASYRQRHAERVELSRDLVDSTMAADEDRWAIKFSMRTGPLVRYGDTSRPALLHDWTDQAFDLDDLLDQLEAHPDAVRDALRATDA